MKQEEIKKAVRERYGSIAVSTTGAGCGCSPQTETQSCCGPETSADVLAKKIGYSADDLSKVPDGANMGLGCGNPVALATLKPGEVVLDLGSGGGLDCFLAAGQVGETGRVIGVDMTPEMIDKAKQNAEKGGFENVEFRKGEIESLPVADGEVDVIISNCVINLSPDKGQVFREAYRSLKAGGRLMVSDMVLLRELPKEIFESVSAYVACIAGALAKDDYLDAIRAAGFSDVTVVAETMVPTDFLSEDPALAPVIERAKKKYAHLDDGSPFVSSIKVSAVKSDGAKEALRGCCG